MARIASCVKIFTRPFTIKFLNNLHIVMISTVCAIKISNRNTLHFINSANFSTSHFPKTTRKILKGKKSVRDVKTTENDKSDCSENQVPKILLENSTQDRIQFSSETRTNEINVQMLSKNIYHQLFGDQHHKSTVSSETVQKSISFYTFSNILYYF